MIGSLANRLISRPHLLAGRAKCGASRDSAISAGTSSGVGAISMAGKNRAYNSAGDVRSCHRIADVALVK
jgi:hypothetical protein